MNHKLKFYWHFDMFQLKNPPLFRTPKNWPLVKNDASLVIQKMCKHGPWFIFQHLFIEKNIYFDTSSIPQNCVGRYLVNTFLCFLFRYFIQNLFSAKSGLNTFWLLSQYNTNLFWKQCNNYLLAINFFLETLKLKSFLPDFIDVTRVC